MKPTALVITTAGINCDRELIEAFELAGAEPRSVHLARLMDEPDQVDRFDLIGLPGGFGYGDAIAAGRIAAALMRERLYPAFMRAVRRGVPMIAPCNGFQTAVQLGLLPGVAADEDVSAPAEAPAPSVALLPNAQGRFVDRWVRIEIPAQTRCIWTQGLACAGPVAVLPVAHGEGRFVARDASLLAELEAAGQIAVRYAADDNPNGSAADIAGICDPTGLILGLMPHPERYTSWLHHPFWTRLSEADRAGDPPGLAMFRQAVRHATQVALGV